VQNSEEQLRAAKKREETLGTVKKNKNDEKTITKS